MTYKCDVCEKRFSFRNNLKQNTLADLGDPANRSKVPYRKCKIEYTNRATLRVHFRINTLVKRFLNVRNVTRHLQGLTNLLYHMYRSHGWGKHLNVKSVIIDVNYKFKESRENSYSKETFSNVLKALWDQKKLCLPYQESIE